MIGLFDSKGKRLSLTWQDYEFNGAFDDAETFNGADQEGVFMDAITMSTPINYQSEVQNDLAKQGGGIEYYNPRVASRVLNIRGRVQAASIGKLHENLNHIQKMFSPMFLQYKHSGWPVASGRPEWSDPWTTLFLPLKFQNLTDASINTDMSEFVGVGYVPMQYAVVPLTLPDPTVSAIGTGWGATIELSWLILDGGVAMAQAPSVVAGDGTIVPNWMTIPAFPKIEWSTTGAGATDLTIAFATADPRIADGTIVINGSALTTGKAIDIIVRDREVYEDGVLNNGLIVSATWPMVSPDFDTAITWTNTTNITANKVDWYEVLSA